MDAPFWSNSSLLLTSCIFLRPYVLLPVSKVFLTISDHTAFFVSASIPNFLIPLIQCTNEIELFDNIRAIALSVLGILCQVLFIFSASLLILGIQYSCMWIKLFSLKAREPTVIKWAIESNMLDVCSYIIDKGSELTKVVNSPLFSFLLFFFRICFHASTYFSIHNLSFLFFICYFTFLCSFY